MWESMDIFGLEGVESRRPKEWESIDLSGFEIDIVKESGPACPHSLPTISIISTSLERTSFDYGPLREALKPCHSAWRRLVDQITAGLDQVKALLNTMQERMRTQELRVRYLELQLQDDAEWEREYFSIRSARKTQLKA